MADVTVKISYPLHYSSIITQSIYWKVGKPGAAWIYMCLLTNKNNKATVIAKCVLMFSHTTSVLEVLSKL